MGCSVFITTNAAGFINQQMKIGDIALITDHFNGINRPFEGGIILTHYNPILVALFDKMFRLNRNVPETFSHSDMYDEELIQIARETFSDLGLPLVEGHYCYYALPNYESKADI